ncbi:MAG: formimidoylglutamate deiminase [Polyangiaceae bacterium]
MNSLATLTPTHVRLPALGTAHSHAFQRAMRGTAQRRAASSDDFWTWRGQMYRVASSLTPESMGAIARVAYRELRRAGVHTVGEFHYVHHQPDGTPYDDRTLLAEAVIEAAKAEGLRIALLRVAYHRAGPGRDREDGQRRFCDPDVDTILRDVDTLRARHAGDPDVAIGLAPHSVRAIPPSWIRPLAAYADTHALPFHMHVAEQPREIEECLAETGRRPMELLADHGALSSRFVAVHATHLLPHEAALLGKAGGFACICATTERDLGDGLPDLGALRANGVKLTTGIDSHVVTDVIDDVRALETQERLRTRSRVTFDDAVRTPAEQLWFEGSHHAAMASGFADVGADVLVRRDHPTLELVAPEHLVDAIVFSGHAGLVDRIDVRRT